MTCVKNSVTVAALACVLMSCAGCPDKRELAQMPTDLAWTKMRDNEKLIDILTIPVNGPLPDRIRQLQRDEQARAEEAMRGSKPVEVYQRAVDNTAMRLAADLPVTTDIIKAQGGDRQVMVAYELRTSFEQPNRELQNEISKLTTKLMGNEAVKRRFVFLTHGVAEATKALANAGAGKFYDYVDPYESAGGAKQVKYHPNSIYELKGSASTSKNLAQHRMWVNVLVEIWHPNSRQSVKRYDSTEEFRFHPVHGWISRAEDEQLAVTWKASHEGGPAVAARPRPAALASASR